MLRTSWLLTLVALVTLASAFNLGEIHMDGVEAYLHKGMKRQATGTGNTSPAPTATPTPTPTPAPATSTPRPTQASPSPASTAPPNSPTPNPPSSASPESPESPAAPASSQAPASSRQTTATQRTSANANSPASTAAGTSTRTTAIVRTSHLVSTSVQIFTTVITTESNGAQIAITSTGTTSVAITTGQVTFTDPPTSQANDGDNGDGLSASNKKVIGGVVGGIGGALLLGGIALVFWRMKKRQHKVTADDDDLNLNTGAALGDKPHNGLGASPFQSNLDQYHNPGGRPNAAANF